MSRPVFYICACPDAGLIKEHIEDIVQAHPPKGGGAWQRHVYWGDDDLAQSFWKHLTLQGLFSTPVLLIVRNAQNLPAATWKNLSEALEAIASDTWPIFCLEVPFEKGQAKIPAHINKLACINTAKSKGFFWQHAGLDAQGLKRHVLAKAKACGLQFDPKALDAFCSSTLPDATAIDGEIQKLMLLADQGQVSEDMINIGAYLPESNIFAFISCIQAGNISAAWREIYRGQKDIAGLLFPLLALLTREARILWQILAKEQVHIHYSVAQQKERLAKKLGFSGVAKIFALIVQAEQQVKSGSCDAEQALESMVVDLVQLFA